MFNNRPLEKAIASVISASYASNGVTGWDIVTSFSTGSIGGSGNNPVVEIVCGNAEPMMPYNRLGYSKIPVTVATVAVKTITTATEFETVSDFTFDPFLADNGLTNLSSYAPTLIIKSVVDNGLNVTSVNDVWMATQDLEIIVGRAS